MFPSRPDCSGAGRSSYAVARAGGSGVVRAGRPRGRDFALLCFGLRGDSDSPEVHRTSGRTQVPCGVTRPAEAAGPRGLTAERPGVRPKTPPRRNPSIVERMKPPSILFIEGRSP